VVAKDAGDRQLREAAPVTVKPDNRGGQTGNPGFTDRTVRPLTTVGALKTPDVPRVATVSRHQQNSLVIRGLNSRSGGSAFLSGRHFRPAFAS